MTTVYFNPLVLQSFRLIITQVITLLLSGNPHVSSKANVAFFIFVVGFVVVVCQLVFCLEESFISAAFTRPFTNCQHGAIKLRNDTQGRCLVVSIRAEHIPHSRWLSLLGMKLEGMVV